MTYLTAEPPQKRRRDDKPSLDYRGEECSPLCRTSHYSPRDHGPTQLGEIHGPLWDAVDSLREEAEWITGHWSITGKAIDSLYKTSNCLMRQIEDATKRMMDHMADIKA